MANDQDPPRRRFLKAGVAAGAALGAGSVAHAATQGAVQATRRPDARGRAVLRRASGGYRDAAAEPYVRGGARSHDRQTRRRDRPSENVDRRGRAHVARRHGQAAARRRQGRARFRRYARPRCSGPDDHVRFRPGPVHARRQGPLRSREAPARRARRFAALQRRPVAAAENRRRHPDPGLRQRRASRVPCRAPTRAHGLRHRGHALGPGGFPLRSAWTDAAQPDGLQGRHQQSVDRATGADESVRVGQRAPTRRG